MPENKKPTTSEKKSITIHGDVTGNNVIIGDNNTVNQTFIQKFFNIFKSDSETLEHRNRRILLNHVENAWIKGVLDASLHGAALLDLGIKQDPNAVTQYPWAIKKESTDETLPAGLSMLEIFDSIGMGRSLLILGAPGSGKTTMLLELARQLIARAREDVTQPIPMVFNLASWTEKLSLADWLAQELNNLYSVPRKTAPDWVMGDKLLLLLDGLDEVRQESRAKCVEAINEFRKQNGLTSLAVCSRSQDYANLKAKLSFEGAVEVQPLTQEQIARFFNSFGDEMLGIKRVLEKDSALREMAETPLFLSIMLMAYRDRRDVDIWVSKDGKAQRKHLFDTYVERMFERPRLQNVSFELEDVLHWLSWLATKLINYDQSVFLLERIQRDWLSTLFHQRLQRIIDTTILSIIFGFVMAFTNGWVTGFGFSMIFWLIWWTTDTSKNPLKGEVLTWSWNSILKVAAESARDWLLIGLVLGGVIGLVFNLGLKLVLVIGLIIGLAVTLMSTVARGIDSGSIDKINVVNQGIRLSAKNFATTSFFYSLAYGSLSGLGYWLISKIVNGIHFDFIFPVAFGLTTGMMIGLMIGGYSVVYHYTIRLLFYLFNFAPLNYKTFLDHCVDLIFLRRVGGGYIFVHRLLMEHFAEMYVEAPTSKGK